MSKLSDPENAGIKAWIDLLTEDVREEWDYEATLAHPTLYEAGKPEERYHVYKAPAYTSRSGKQFPEAWYVCDTHTQACYHFQGDTSRPEPAYEFAAKWNELGDNLWGSPWLLEHDRKLLEKA